MKNLFANSALIRTEIVAGVTTFLTMAYIMFVNPEILSKSGMDKNALIVATCLASALACICVGVFTDAPIAMAPGMGLNAFFTYSLVIGEGVAWETALGVVFISGLLFFVLTVAGLRRRIVEAIPQSMVYAIAVGIGIFIAFIGLINMGLVISNKATLIGIGAFNEEAMIGLGGLLIMIILHARSVRGAVLYGIIASTILALILGKAALPEHLVSFDINIRPTFMKLDIPGALKWGFAGVIFSFMFMDMFDSIGTLIACSHKAKKVDGAGKIKGLDKLLGIDALATSFGAMLGTSPVTAYIESGAGIEAGGRRGLTAIVVGGLFLLGMFFIPVIAIVPPYATAPALIMVGLFMVKEVTHIDFANIEEGFPSFIIILMIALSYSISTGLALGFISHVLLKVVLAKHRDVKPAMWVIALLSLFFLLK